MSASLVNNPETGGSNTQASSSAQVNAEEPQVTQIRQLLFGEQMVDYEKRFEQLEKKLNDEINLMRASVEKSLTEIQESLQKRSNEVQAASVPRAQIAESLEQLARTLRT